MLFYVVLWLSTFLLVSGSSLLPLLPIFNRPLDAAIPEPENDPFYKPPAGFASQAPGAILKARKLPHDDLQDLLLFPQNLHSVFQLLYRTVDSQDKPTATVVTIMVPYHANSSRLLIYNTIENADFIQCAPSYSLRRESNKVAKVGQAEMLLMEAFLSKGYIVATPDYEGPYSGFGNGILAGHATLDAVRATLESAPGTGLDPHPEIQMYGYSGGAVPVSWAIYLRASYAPEINFIGAAFGGTLVEMDSSIRMLAKNHCKYALMGIVGLANSVPQFNAYVQHYVRPERAEFIDRYKHKCLQLTNDEQCDALDNYFTIPDVLNTTIARQIMERFHLGTEKAWAPPPSTPILMYHSLHDDTLPYGPAHDLFKQWCSHGSRIHFISDKHTSHFNLAIVGVAEAINFITDRFNGVSFGAQCSEEIVPSMLNNARALTTFLVSVLKVVTFLLGLPVGPGIL
ncbi:secretory lipase-domain-containing protein [Gongronella butleri]|nr:secretory lipase-domain-containing protein [Gongronella butleri]